MLLSGISITTPILNDRLPVVKFTFFAASLFVFSYKYIIMNKS